MINLYYSEAYWGHSATMNGPHKVVDNLIKSLDQEKIEYAINEEKYEHNFLVQYDATAHKKHSEIEQDTTIIGPQVWLFDGYGQFLILFSGKSNLRTYKSFTHCEGVIRNL